MLSAKKISFLNNNFFDTAKYKVNKFADWFEDELRYLFGVVFKPNTERPISPGWVINPAKP